MGLTVGADGRTTAYPQLLVAQQVLGHVGLLIMLGVTALTAVNTFNGGFVTLSRFVYAVAREGKLPRALTRLNEHAVPVVPVWILGISSLVLAMVVSVTGSWVMAVSLCAALEMMIYATAAYVVWRLRRREAGTDRPFRLVAGRSLALAFAVVFGGLALISSVTVGKTISAAPLVLLAVIVGLVTLYVLTYVPRLERRDAAELAARRAARAAERAAASVAEENR
jgi:amino acid transporter